MQTQPITPNNQKYIPALRLVDTKTLDHEQWLEARRQGIGGSDAAAAVGLSPYQSQLELWLDKTGRQTPPRKEEENIGYAPMLWGSQLEHLVARHYQAHTGHRVRRVNAILQHPEYPWMLANLDREVVGTDEVDILECKTAGQYGAAQWKDGVPEHVQLQVQHQLAVTGKQVADVAVLICGQDFQVHRIHRNEKVIAQLIKLEEKFWQYVQTDTPPPADGSSSAANALQALYPKDNGKELDWRDDDALNHLFTELQDVRHQAAKCKGKEEKLKQQIQEVMGEATQALFKEGAITWRRSQDYTTLDTKRLLAEHPELIKQYPLTRKGSRRFIVQNRTN